jgi:hypothetical protein
MRTDADRSEKYTAKYNAATIGLKIASMLSGMKSGFASAINDLVSIEQQAQGLLNISGTQRVEYPVYYNFVRELWAIQSRGITGHGLTVAGVGLEAKYASYGLDPNLLKSMALTLFGVVIP